ncbi:MAG: class I SAM-dependent methyltransferase [Deltaproteobacteria bacterium]|nr:class I SAM-dependent methyltransferase [Deltaproteobacteria bacterium]
MKINRVDILNRLAARFGYRSYLEIGVAGGSSFRNVQVEDKLGVDPAWRRWYIFRREIKKITSDRFFERNQRTFDLIFVDGLHHADQAYKDIRNSLEVLNPGGAILVHDCIPSTREQQIVPRMQSSWTGDVWRAYLKISQDPDLTTWLFNTNRGCGLVRKGQRPEGFPFPPTNIDPMDPELEWEDYDQQKDSWLKIYRKEEVYSTIDSLPR